MTLQERVQAVFDSFNEACRQDPNLVPIFGARYNATPTSLVVEHWQFPPESIKLLESAGFDVAVRPDGNCLLIRESKE